MERVNQIVMQKPAAISTQQSSSPEAEVLISGELLKLAESRQAAITRATLEVYAETLKSYPLERIRQACLALRKRGEYETAFPDLETVETAVKKAEADAKPKYQPCEKCDSMGWIVKTRENGNTYAEECECKKAWRKSCEPVSEAVIERARVAGQ